MKYVKYTYVDAATNKPVSEEHARRGPKHPDGVTPTIGVEDSFQTGIPTFYGMVDDNYQPPYWMVGGESYGLITEEEFFAAIKLELYCRADRKKRAVEFGGIYVDGMFLDTDEKSQNRVTSMVLILDHTPSIESIDFKLSIDQWAKIGRDDAIDIARKIGLHSQECFAWNSQKAASISNISSLEDVLPCLLEINHWQGTEWSSAPTEIEG